MVAVPSATPLTTPLSSTVATDSSLEDQNTVSSMPQGRTSAESWIVPVPMTVASAGVTVTDSTSATETSSSRLIFQVERFMA